MALALAVPATFAVADHGGCPPFERLRYDLFVEFSHGGDLFSTVHVVGFTDLRFCNKTRDRVTSEDIRWESRGGEYALRVVGEGFDDLHSLHAGANWTSWYRHADVGLIQVVGVAKDLRPTIIAGEEPPSLVGAVGRFAR